MNLKLVKVKKTTKEGKEFYEFYLQLENNMRLRVQPNSYEDKQGAKHSNYQQLVLVAIDDLPF